jgi:hypothetical protein
MGNTLIYLGIGLIIAGIAYKLDLLHWFGNLPGDIITPPSIYLNF